jgi:hypothetical protein
LILPRLDALTLAVQTIPDREHASHQGRRRAVAEREGKEGARSRTLKTASW